MKNKITCLIGFISLLLAAPSAYGQASVAMNTYYTSPYGSYARIRLVPRSILLDSVCDANNYGLQYVEEPLAEEESIPHFCYNVSGTPTWRLIDDIWTSNTTAATIVLKTDSANVGIGTSTPATKLNISGATATADVRVEGDSDSSGASDAVSVTMQRGSGGTAATGRLGFFASNDFSLRNTLAAGKIHLGTGTTGTPRLTVTHNTTDNLPRIGINDQTPSALFEITEGATAVAPFMLSSNDTAGGNILRVTTTNNFLINYLSTDTVHLANSKLAIQGLGADSAEIALGGNGGANGTYDLMYDGGTAGAEAGVARFVHTGNVNGSLMFQYLNAGTPVTAAQIRNDGLVFVGDKVSVGRDPALVHGATELQVHETDAAQDLVVVLTDNGTNTGFNDADFPFITSNTIGAFLPWHNLTAGGGAVTTGGLQIAGFADGAGNVPGLSLIGAVGSPNIGNMPTVDISGYRRDAAGNVVNLGPTDIVLGINFASSIANSLLMVTAQGRVGIGFTAINNNRPSQLLHVNGAMRLSPLPSPPSGTEACTAGSPGPQNGSLYVDSSGALCFCYEGTWYKAGGSAAGACN